MDKEREKQIDRMHIVLFGDEESGSKGMVQKVDVIYDMFIKIGNGISLIGWVIGAVIIFGLFLGTIKGWLIAGARQFLKQ